MSKGVLTVTAFVHVSGPIADGTASDVLARFDEDVRHTIAEKGADMLRHWPFKGAKGGGFQANIHVVEGGGVSRIPGPMIRGVTWSPWLEGVSKRNSSTRFKGYHLFRTTAERLQEEAGEIGDKVLQKYLPEMGGG